MSRILGVTIYKNSWFAKFARKERISDAALCVAIDRAGRGLIDADLGSGLIKQRVAREGAGKSGGYRTLIFFRAGERSIFVFGFAKSDKANLDCRGTDGVQEGSQGIAPILARASECVGRNRSVVGGEAWQRRFIKARRWHPFIR
jgi:hypothetical protein